MLMTHHIPTRYSSVTRPFPISTPFPYTTLFRSPFNAFDQQAEKGLSAFDRRQKFVASVVYNPTPFKDGAAKHIFNGWTDRKSTRLNSSHMSISYAVFCLKKKIDRRVRRREMERA